MIDEDDFGDMPELMIQLSSMLLGVSQREYNFASAHYDYQILGDLPRHESERIRVLDSYGCSIPKHEQRNLTPTIESVK